MPAGTIVLTINSKTVTGSGTAFTTELKVNDFVVAVVGGVTYTLGVAAIVSNTSLTLNTAFDGPTASGVAWTALPNQAMVGITAQIASDTARAIRGLNYDKDNWLKVYSDAASVTVQRPDGSTFTGPSWGYVANQYSNKAGKGANSDITSITGLTTPLSLSQGGVGATTQAGAQSVLGLGSAATKSTGLLSGQVPVNGASFGIGLLGGGLETASSTIDPIVSALKSRGLSPFRNMVAMSGTTYDLSVYSSALWNQVGDTWWLMCVPHISGPIKVMSGYGNAGVTTNRILRDSLNTTVDSNGFIKSASPILKVFSNGDYESNDESEGAKSERSGVGKYLVTGAVSMASEGWTIEGPQDENGNRLCFIETSIEDGIINVRVSSRRFDINTAMIVAGDPMDIPEGRWIDLRLQMPEDSVWKNRMKEAEKHSSEQHPDS